jgi:hypothetical protein
MIYCNTVNWTEGEDQSVYLYLRQLNIAYMMNGDRKSRIKIVVWIIRVFNLCCNTLFYRRRESGQQCKDRVCWRLAYVYHSQNPTMVMLKNRVQAYNKVAKPIPIVNVLNPQARDLVTHHTHDPTIWENTTRSLTTNVWYDKADIPMWCTTS